MEYFLLFIIILIILFVVFIFRFVIYNAVNGLSSNMTKDEALKTGYGYYEEIITPCETENGKCSEVGTLSKYKECIPHPATNRGCLIETNDLWRLEQSYKSSKVENVACSSSCRSSIWELDFYSECVISTKDNLKATRDGFCINSLTPPTGYRTRNSTCVPNDATGINTCTYSLSSNNGSLGGLMSEGCAVGDDGVTVTCQVGAKYSHLEMCEVTNIPICENFKRVEACTPYEDEYYFTDKCRSFFTGEYITGDENLFQSGWSERELHLDEFIDDGLTLKQVRENMENKIGTIVNNKCIKPCIYVNRLEGNWSRDISELVPYYLNLRKDNYYLSLENGNYIFCDDKNKYLSLAIKPTRNCSDFNSMYCNIHCSPRGWLNWENGFFVSSSPEEFILRNTFPGLFNIENSRGIIFSNVEFSKI